MDPNESKDFYAYEQITDMDEDSNIINTQSQAFSDNISSLGLQMPSKIDRLRSPTPSQNANVLEIDFESVKNQISKLTLWDCPKKSGIVLGVLLFIEIVLMSMSFLSIIGYSGLALLIFFFGYRVFLRITGKEDSYEILKKLDTQLSLSQDECDKFSRKFGKKLEKLINFLRELFLMKNIGNSLKFAGFLYLLTYIGATMNFLTLCLLATIFSFTLPKIYQLKKNEIDQLMDVAKDHVKQISAKAYDKFNEIKNSKLKGKLPEKKVE